MQFIRSKLGTFFPIFSWIIFLYNLSFFFFQNFPFQTFLVSKHKYLYIYIYIYLLHDIYIFIHVKKTCPLTAGGWGRGVQGLSGHARWECIFFVVLTKSIQMKKANQNLYLHIYISYFRFALEQRRQPFWPWGILSKGVSPKSRKLKQYRKQKSKFVSQV